MLHWAPPRPLAHFVRSIRVASAVEGIVPRYERLPDGECELVLRADASEQSMHVVGTRTHAFRKTPLRPTRAYRVRFRAAGAYPFFGRPVSELTDRFFTMRELWGDESDVFARLLDTRVAPEQGAAVVLDALGRRLASDRVFEPSAAGAVRRAVHLLDARPLPSVPSLAREVGLSERQLRRAFEDVVGITPKRFLRIMRFRRALEAARHGHAAESWSRLAEAHGYFDQAHLIKDFRELGGATPTALLAEQR